MARHRWAHRLAVGTAALLLLGGALIFLSGFALLLHSPEQCFAPPSLASPNSSSFSSSARRALHAAEPSLPSTLPLSLVLSGRALLAVASEATQPQQRGRLQTSSTSSLLVEADTAGVVEAEAGDTPSAYLTSRRRLSCAPDQCPDMIQIGQQMASVRRSWHDEGDVSINAYLDALRSWYPLLDIGSGNSAIQVGICRGCTASAAVSCAKESARPHCQWNRCS